jgi:hypothetical protein
MGNVLNKTTEMLKTISTTLGLHLTQNGTQSIKSNTMELGLTKASPENLKEPIQSSQGSVVGPDFSLFFPSTKLNSNESTNSTANATQYPSSLIQKVK